MKNLLSIEAKDMIGKPIVGYNCPAGDFKWRIFHVEGKKVYIITDDYIPFNVAPLSRKGSSLYPNTNYGLSFDDVVDDYKGSEDITDAKIKDLNSLYFKANPTKNANPNMKAVAYMLDTNVWSKFAGDMAEYAIGGPTLELFVESYNLTHERKIKIRAYKTGYMIKYEDESVYHNYSSTLSSSDGLYFKDDTRKAYAMWLASPSVSLSDFVINVHYNGNVDFSDYSNGSIGFRPLVCLKSDILFEEEEDELRII